MASFEPKLSKCPRGIFSAPLWLLIRFYQLAISPLIHLIPGSGCRFYPTCSNYALDALRQHGAIKGSILTFCRIVRCNPLCKGGLDYVPKKFEWKKIFSQNGVDESQSSDK